MYTLMYLLVGFASFDQHKPSKMIKQGKHTIHHRLPSVGIPFVLSYRWLS